MCEPMTVAGISRHCAVNQRQSLLRVVHQSRGSTGSCGMEIGNVARLDNIPKHIHVP